MCQSQSKNASKKRSPSERYDDRCGSCKERLRDCHLARSGEGVKQLRVSRPKLVSFFAKQSAATVLLEACVSAHFWARTLRRLGHDVVLLPPHLVRPYRRGSKNDRADTKALLEAYRNEEILSVPIKSVRQHTLAALHRLRSGWLSTRTARINAVRGILRELGLFILKGAHFVVPAISELVEDADSDLPTCSVRTRVMRAPRFESSRTSALASSTSSRRSPSSFLRCNDFSPFPASDF